MSLKPDKSDPNYEAELARRKADPLSFDSNPTINLPKDWSNGSGLKDPLKVEKPAEPAKTGKR